MERFDAAVIGGGLLGCFTARELARFDLRVLLIEAAEDVCTGISKSNTAIVYTGFDSRPGSLKAGLTARANAAFGELCAELGVPFSRCGSLMTACGPAAAAVLEKKLRNAEKSRIPGVSLISGAEARELEPALSERVQSALYAENTGTVSPWSLCFAAFENALDNGCTVRLNTRLLSIRRQGKEYVLETGRGEFCVKSVANCAGLCADRVHEMLFEPSVRIVPTGGDYMVLGRGSVSLRHVIRSEPEDGGKGVNLVPTVEGSVLLGPTDRECPPSLTAVDAGGLRAVRAAAAEIVPSSAGGAMIRSFAAVRPNPVRVVRKNGAWQPCRDSLGDFVIERPEESFISFIGVKTPGLTCARELGALAAESLAACLGAVKRDDFNPVREAPVSVRALAPAERAELLNRERDYANIICRCEKISEGEILDAIRRGAVTVDGVKRRCGAMLGSCQGSRCRYEIAKLLSRELGLPAAHFLHEGGDGRE